MKAILLAAGLLILSCSRSVEGGPPSQVRIAGEALELSLAVDGEARIDEPVKWRIDIRNVSPREVHVFPPLDGSDVGMRYPLYVADIHGPDGKRVPIRSARGCGNCNVIRQGELIRLKAGEAFQPLDAAPIGHVLQRWKPTIAGRHVLKLRVDFSATDPGKWNGSMERMHADRDQVGRLLAGVPVQRLESSIEFDVVP